MSMSATQLSNARLILADQGSDAVQGVVLSGATGGTWTVTLNGQTTSALAFDAGANDLQNALAALSTIGLGNVAVNTSLGVPGTLTFAVMFSGTLAHTALSMLTINTSGLTGPGAVATVTQLSAGGVTVFTDDDLSSQYSLAKSNYFLSIAYLFRILWSNAAKFNDYTAGQSSEKKSQITDNLKELEALYQQWAQADRQVQFASLVAAPPRLRAVPWQQGQPSTSLQYGPPYGWLGRGRWGN